MINDCSSNNIKLLPDFSYISGLLSLENLSPIVHIYEYRLYDSFSYDSSPYYNGPDLSLGLIAGKSTIDDTHLKTSRFDIDEVTGHVKFYCSLSEGQYI